MSAVSKHHSVVDLKRQISRLERMISDGKEIAKPLGEEAVKAFVKKWEARLAERQRMLREVKEELRAR